MVKTNTVGDVYTVGEFEVSALMGDIDVWLVSINGVGQTSLGEFNTEEKAEVAMVEAYNDSLTALDVMKESVDDNKK